jgi:inositol oxygenase
MAFPTTDEAPAPEAFRDHARGARASVRELYRENHAKQTLAFVLAKQAEYLPPRRTRMGVWEAFESLGRFVDDSDPDLDLPQVDHALQTAQSLRAAGRPDWLVLTGFLHDVGKVLHLFGEPQWAVVGDTFPVGCAFSERIVFPELFAGNPDGAVPEYATRLGIYDEGCGLDRVHLSWGHDEYLHGVVKDHLPEPALYVIRYHSFYAQHQERAYDFLLDARDRRLMEVVQEFQPHDLYSKSAERPSLAQLRPYYEDLIAKFLPDTLMW